MAGLVLAPSIALFAGCGREPEAPAPRPTIAHALESDAARPVVAEEGAATVQLRFDGLSPMYAAYFADPAFVAPLGTGLGACTRGVADVVVSYEDANKLGSIVLATSPRALDCRPKETEAGWDLTPLVPVTKALAAYRDDVAAQRDFRISSFRTGIAYLRGAHLCTIYLGGQYPPDGSTFSPCVELAGVESCEGDPEAGVTTLPFGADERLAYLRECLGS